MRVVLEAEQELLAQATPLKTQDAIGSWAGVWEGGGGGLGGLSDAMIG